MLSGSRMQRNGALLKAMMLLMFAWAGTAVSSCEAGAQNTPGELLVSLDARDPTAATENWKSAGTLGPFARVGSPRLSDVAGVRAVVFDGQRDAYRGPRTTPSMEGDSPRTIEIWAFNPSIDAPEETLVAWGRRGGPDTTDMSFNWGNSGAYGAATHWAVDMGWNGVPAPGTWHYLVYTYDGKTARVFDDTLEKSRRNARLNTAAGYTINIAAQNTAEGVIQFRNEFDQSQQAGSVAIAIVRVRSGAMTTEQIAHTFEREAERFGARRPPAAALLAQGVEKFNVGGFTLSLLRATQTAASLSPHGSAFDFLPADRLSARTGERYYHLGDITFRTRGEGGEWRNFSSSAKRENGRRLLVRGALAAYDLTPDLGTDCPLDIHREWTDAGGHLALRFRVKNRTHQPVELGALGAPMVFNNVLTGRSLDEAHEVCSFADPYIGGESGYLQVVRLSGQGPVLLVLPEPGNTFEAYRPLYDDPTPRDVTFEGFYEWMCHTRAYADREWSHVEPWNQPTARTLKPGEVIVYGFQFVLAPGVRDIEPTLVKLGRPVAIGTPGYVLPTDQTGHLFLHARAPIRAWSVEPAGALKIIPSGSPTSHGWRRYNVSGKTIGRCRLTVAYTDGLHQEIHYNIIPPEIEQVRRLGAFHTAYQWFTDTDDPFHRAPSFMPFHRDTDQIVLQHSHTWFVGLSDEIGAGPSVAMAMKNLEQPDAAEIALLEEYVNKTLWGHLQNPDYSVKASLFYYEPRLMPPGYYTVRGGWDKARTETTWRAYNYPHVAAVYWALYRLARNHKGLVRQRPWHWYLRQSYETAMAMPRFAGGLAQFGLMVGSVFPEILRDLRTEGWKQEAHTLEAAMRRRTVHWVSLRYPFGSEMPWDSTGQEEIYGWCRWFGFNDKADVTLNAILAYVPTVPNWAYNGAARRYFDAPVNGTKWPQIVRMTNHYGSTLNALPLLDAFRRNPSDLHLLRAGYAGATQIMANIDSSGFGSYGFDADPAVLKFDPYTADYGIAFYGYARSAGAYIARDPELGLLGFGCDVGNSSDGAKVTPRDGLRKRVFIGPLGLWLTLDAGSFRSVQFNERTRAVEITLISGSEGATTALLHMDMPARSGTHVFLRRPALHGVNDAFQIPLHNGAARVRLQLR